MSRTKIAKGLDGQNPDTPDEITEAYIAGIVGAEDVYGPDEEPSVSDAERSYDLETTVVLKPGAKS